MYILHGNMKNIYFFCNSDFTEWVSEWLLFNANSAIFQLHVYHVKNKLIFNEMMMRLGFVLDQHAELDFFS
jgi:hypothetical protein